METESDAELRVELPAELPVNRESQTEGFRQRKRFKRKGSKL